MQRNREVFVQIGWLVLIVAFCVALYINACAIAAPGKLPGQLGPDMWPRMLLTLLMFLSVAKIIALLIQGEQPKPETAVTVETDSEEPRRNSKVLGIAILVLFGFVAAIEIMGFMTGCLAFLAVFTYLGRWRNKKALLLISTVGTLFITFLFVKWIYIPLPRGRFFFHDLTTALYKLLGIF